MKDIVLVAITRLKADAPIAAVVSTRIYRYGSVPSNPTLPYIIVSRVSGIRTNDGHTGMCRYQKTRIQCSTFASTDQIADNLSELIADSLNTVTSTSLSPGVYVIDIYDAGTVPDNNPAVPVFMYHRDFIVRHGA